MLQKNASQEAHVRDAILTSHVRQGARVRGEILPLLGTERLSFAADLDEVLGDLPRGECDNNLCTLMRR